MSTAMVRVHSSRPGQLMGAVKQRNQRRLPPGATKERMSLSAPGRSSPAAVQWPPAANSLSLEPTRAATVVPNNVAMARLTST